MSVIKSACVGSLKVSVAQICDEDFYQDSVLGLQSLILPGDCVRTAPTTADKREQDSEAIKAIAAKYKIRLAGEDAYTVENLLKSKNKSLHKGFYAHLVYRHMHRYVSYALKPFNIRFESACIGYIVVTAAMLKNAGMENTEENAHKLMAQELQDLANYQNGEAYMVTIENDDEFLDCFTVIGYNEQAITSSLVAIDPSFDQVATALFQ